MNSSFLSNHLDKAIKKFEACCISSTGIKAENDLDDVAADSEPFDRSYRRKSCRVRRVFLVQKHPTEPLCGSGNVHGEGRNER